MGEILFEDLERFPKRSAKRRLILLGNQNTLEGTPQSHPFGHQALGLNLNVVQIGHHGNEQREETDLGQEGPEDEDKGEEHTGKGFRCRLGIRDHSFSFSLANNRFMPDTSRRVACSGVKFP